MSWIHHPTPYPRWHYAGQLRPRRRAYASALRRLDVWLAGRELDAAPLATYLATSPTTPGDSTHVLPSSLIGEIHLNTRSIHHNDRAVHGNGPRALGLGSSALVPLAEARERALANRRVAPEKEGHQTRKAAGRHSWYVSRSTFL